MFIKQQLLTFNKIPINKTHFFGLFFRFYIFACNSEQKMIDF